MEHLLPQSTEDVISHLSDLPTFPKVTAKLFALLRDPAVPVSLLAETIAADPALAAKVVRLANSPFYMISRPIKSISDAVFVLGINSVKSLTSAATIKSGFSTFIPRRDVFDLTEFWKHSFATAMVARHLAVKSGNQLSEFLYLAGIIHDIGKLIIAYYWPESWKQIVADSLINPNEAMSTYELKYFLVTHSELIGRLCRNWQMPAELSELVGNMQNREEYDGQLSEELGMLRQSDDFANRAGLVFPRGSAELEEVDLDIVGLSRDSLITAVDYQLVVLER